MLKYCSYICGSEIIKWLQVVSLRTLSRRRQCWNGHVSDEVFYNWRASNHPGLHQGFIQSTTLIKEPFLLYLMKKVSGDLSMSNSLGSKTLKCYSMLPHACLENNPECNKKLCTITLHPFNCWRNKSRS